MIPIPTKILVFLFLSLIHRVVSAQNIPNIVVFIADDAGVADFGCYGNTAIRTPHIDSLARAGKIFTQAFLPSPQCSPTRTSLLAGQFAHTLRTEDLHSPLSAKHKIIPFYLRKAGYYTALLGKSHIGEAAEAQFDEYASGNGNPKIEDFEEVMQKAGEKPFFVWYAFSDPHRPYQENTIDAAHDPSTVKVPPFLADTPETRQDLAHYYDEISRMDKQIGQAVKALEAGGKLQNTLLLFLSDNGMPFTRAKGTLYDTGIQTPLLVVWPGKIKPGSEFSGLLSMIHLAPTVLEAAGLSKPENMYGNSLLPVWTDQSEKVDPYVFSERNWHDCDEHIRSVRSDSFKLIVNAYLEWPHGTAADLAGSPSHQALLQRSMEGKLKPEQKLIFQVPRPQIEFYNIKEDPHEFHNLAYDASYRPLIQKHYQVLQEWMSKTLDFLPHYRRRYDNTDRVTGTHFRQGVPELYQPLPD